MSADLPIEFNVDAEILAEIDEGGFPFRRLHELKRDDARRWVSPAVHLEMLVYLESKIGDADAATAG